MSNLKFEVTLSPEIQDKINLLESNYEHVIRESESKVDDYKIALENSLLEISNIREQSASLEKYLTKLLSERSDNEKE